MEIEEILIRIFSAILLSMCVGTILFLYWKILCKFFMNQGSQRLFERTLKIVLLSYYIPIIYLVLLNFYEDGYIFYVIPKFKKLIYVAVIIWIVGIIVSFGRILKDIIWLEREKRRCFDCKQWIQQIFAECKHEMKINKEIQIVWGYGIKVPMISGLIHPCVFLPVKEFSKDELRVCLYHELNHYQRRDIFWNYLTSGIICIHWYFPLMRRVWREMDQWSEISCDMNSIQYVGSIQKYFLTILDMSSEMKGYKAYTVACLFENANLLEQRILYTKEYIKRGSSKTIFMIMLFIAFMIAGSTSIFAMTAKYHEGYVEWVKGNENEIEESCDDVGYKNMEEKQENNKKKRIEKRIKVNLKGDTAVAINHTIDSQGGIWFENIEVKKGEYIDISIASQENFKKIRVGISRNKKDIRYVEEKNKDEVEHAFLINKGGRYDVYVENIGEDRLEIVGSLAIMIEGEM